jgi:hypothetical protein
MTEGAGVDLAEMKGLDGFNRARDSRDTGSPLDGAGRE